MVNPTKIFLILLFLSLYFTLFYLISYIAGNILSFSFLFFSLYLLLRQIIQILIYPGSFWFCLRSIESTFCVEMSAMLLYKIRGLRHFVESVNSQEISQLDSDITSVLNDIFNTLTNILNTRQWNKSQRNFYILLSNLKTHLVETHLTSDSFKKSLWEWLDESSNNTIPKNLKFEDSAFSCLKEVIKDCQVLEKLLFKSGGKVKCAQRIKRWIFDDFIWNADYFREDLTMKFKCEQFWVGENEKADCLYLTVDPEGPTMIFFNPNAGFYEFSLYRSEWLEFYCMHKINLLLWNYPGYSRSQSSPSIKKILKSGEEIFSYLRDKKKITKIGLHGKSLGGFVAAHLAHRCKADFLFADRTFSSFSQVALNNFGKLAYFGFKLSCKPDMDSSANYLKTKCYKVMSSDPKDSTIKDFASLKIGVATKLLYEDLPESHILTKEETDNFLGALIRISSLVDQLSLINNEPLKNSLVYQPLKEDLELFDSQGFKESINAVKILFNKLEAGGCPLLESVKVPNAFESLVNWLIVVDIWGISLHSGQTEFIQSTLNTLRSVIIELEAFYDVLQIREDIKDIHYSLKKVKNHIENRVEAFETNPFTTTQELKFEANYNSAGYLISLNCGHAGPFSSLEKDLYRRHLIKSKFIKFSG